MRRFYRIIREPEATVGHFLSDKARGRRPPIDPEYLQLWDGLSVWNTEQQARNRAKSLDLGNYLAVLELPENAPVRWERTLRRPGHHTLWGDPEYLLGCVVSIVPV